MQAITSKLKPALEEVRRTAHDQDLIEVPRRARLDREAESERFLQMPQGGGVPDRSAF
jgi:hypothetical protein